MNKEIEQLLKDIVCCMPVQKDAFVYIINLPMRIIIFNVNGSMSSEIKSLMRSCGN